ncbi:hypothetical protein LCGC14_2502780 [marine sediment metagenome]|uniref:Uncharacterized protein n=1 Tax=marine sediment metagenome TaxID=412755 RepID=A0A0F9B1E8_9ZZZZ
MSEDIQDPFADKMTAHDNGTIENKMNHAHAKSIPPPIDFERIIRRLAEIEDEIASRGIEDLLKEKEALRKALKDAMTRSKSEEEYDETSNHEAVLMQRTKESWDVDILQALLSPAQRKRYIIKSVSEGAVKDGIKNGDLSRGELESKGAVRKTPGSIALYVRERKSENDG